MLRRWYLKKKVKPYHSYCVRSKVGAEYRVDRSSSALSLAGLDLRGGLEFGGVAACRSG